MARKRNIRRQRKPMRKGSRRFNRRGPRTPPAINIDPWFRVTLSFEDDQDDSLNCFTAIAIYKALDYQLNMSRTGKYFVLRIHRVRVWNVTGGPVFLQPCQLVDTHTCGSVVQPLKSIEDYPGRNAWAYAQYSWPRFQQELMIDDNSAEAQSPVVFLRKGKKGDKFVIHLAISFKITTPGSFKKLPISNPPSTWECRYQAATDPSPMDSTSLDLGFENIDISSTEPKRTSVSIGANVSTRVLRSAARRNN